ncbi:flagellar biosynthesis anti-sigma factor FlgM [Parendozoicomonas sp. Alg238-R29]|uniref:flagellar biosynthesis anti-sigma factor FlgM n=1 Tax=Parendozoicomonas sp. Alg238-R29 TaxID=2993446 RepID=UPI00248E1F26|nr:flagellar biosynthesis anti-sigma factor FlgM [Parendozoicomonas sp. Alg238-R29]
MSEINLSGGLSSAGNSPKSDYKSTTSGTDMGDSDRIRSRSGPASVIRKSVSGSASSKASAPAARSQENADKVELSTGARLLEALGGELEPLQDVDLEKVEEVQEVIRQGKMPVDHEQLANRMQWLFNQLPADKDNP